jgi:hypothetical protein
MKFLIIIFFTLATTTLYSQVIPEPGANLAHTQVMFEFPQVKGAKKYKVEISRWDSVKKTSNVISEKFDQTTATLISSLQFGFEYRWKYFAYDQRQQQIFSSPEYLFTTRKPAIPPLDYHRLRLIEANCKDSLDGLIGQDYSKTFYDRKGNPVCYVTEHPPLLRADFFIRDLRMTPGGTITFLSKNDAVELDLNGNIIWVAPNDGSISGEATEFYHHSFSRLKNGNYMVLGNKYKILKAPDDTIHMKIEFGTILEYDLSGKMVWKWNSEDYFTLSDLFARKLGDTSYNVLTHSNSFEVTPDNKYVFFGFREISRIIKIEKASGKVVASYGLKMPSGEAMYANDFFRFQHSSTLLKDGNLAVFNNDSISTPGITSSVVIFSQQVNNNNSSRLLWKFDCKFDTLTNGKSLKTGNVLELPNKNLLVNLGTINRTFEVTRDKKVVWDAFTEKWDPKVEKWIPFPQFRSSYISSLYPCYFVAEIYPASAGQANDPGLKLKIVNKGSETDQYSIAFIAGGKTINASTKSTLPGGSSIIDIPVTVGSRFTIKISSSLDARRYKVLDSQGTVMESTLNSMPQYYYPYSDKEEGHENHKLRFRH